MHALSIRIICCLLHFLISSQRVCINLSLIESPSLIFEVCDTIEIKRQNQNPITSRSCRQVVLISISNIHKAARYQLSQLHLFVQLGGLKTSDFSTRETRRLHEGCLLRIIVTLPALNTSSSGLYQTPRPQHIAICVCENRHFNPRKYSDDAAEY